MATRVSTKNAKENGALKIAALKRRTLNRGLTVLSTKYQGLIISLDNPLSLQCSIPSWVWFLVAWNHFWSHQLDGMDGKQVGLKSFTFGSVSV